MGMVTQSCTPTILLTRPAEQSARFTAQLVTAFGPLSIIQSPLLAPMFLPPPSGMPPCTAVILTSETGAEAARRSSASGVSLPKQAFCVGDATAKAATKAGFQALSAKGDAADLAQLIRQHESKGPLLYLRGEDVSIDLAETLTNGGLVTYSCVVYCQEAQPLTPAATHLLSRSGPVILPIFSPRSAQLLAAALPKAAVAPLWVAALSPNVAKAAAALNPARLQIADHPDAPAMLRAVAALLAAGAMP